MRKTTVPENDLRDLFQFFRENDHEYFFANQEIYQCTLAHFVHRYNVSVERIIEMTESFDWTGKNEFAGKAIIASGGIETEPPQKIADAVKQFLPSIKDGALLLKRHKKNHQRWVGMLASIKKDEEKALARRAVMPKA